MKATKSINDLPLPVWIALMLLGFVLFLPLGLGILVYLIGSGKMKCCMSELARWRNNVLQRCSVQLDESGSTGNMAFDEYREATLKRLEYEQREFVAFLEKLRRAKDKKEFDQFMAQLSSQA